MSALMDIRLTKDESVGGWSAVDVETGVASGGETKEEALDNLDEAVALHSGEAGEEIEDEEAFLRAIGIEPDEVEREEELPEFLC